VFKVNTDGMGFTNLHVFSGGIDGDWSRSQLVLLGNVLYGTTLAGGSSGKGMIFSVNTNGTGFTNLYSFTATLGSGNTNADGANPDAGLILSGNTLYGTAYLGGSSGVGTVFAVYTDGTGFTTLHSFTGSEGANPIAGLILSGNTLYGTTAAGGSSGNGTVFKVNTDGTGFTTLYSFTPPSTTFPYTNSDGAQPWAHLILSGNTLFGTAECGGTSGFGTVFSIFIQPQLTIVPSGQSVILTWPTNYADFTLQTTTNLISPVWITNSQVPVIVNGQNTVTNPISGKQQFFRLSK
jgi:uncharacterized repeat protein (TIGR03803 family)